MNIKGWINKLIPKDNPEPFRYGFEESLIANNPRADISRSGDSYLNHDTQQAWEDWVRLERLKEGAW